MKKTTRVYAVTGEVHGSIVEAMTKKAAIEIFQRVYKGEKILNVKDMEGSNLANL